MTKDPANDWQPVWSPDGNSRKEAGVSVLGVVSAGGGKWTPLTDTTLWADKPRWAPDGKAIYFISNRESAFFDVWGIAFDPVKGVAVGSEYRATQFNDPGRIITGTGGSELGVSATRIVLPIVDTTGSIWVLDNVKR